MHRASYLFLDRAPHRTRSVRVTAVIEGTRVPHQDPARNGLTRLRLTAHMRLSRTSLLARLTAPDVPPVVLFEAPPGYGKSWLARRALDGEVLRLRGELGPLADGRLPASHVLVDDAHLLSREQIDILLEHIED